MNLNPAHLIDGYKINHVFQYPENTRRVYSNFTPRFSRDSDITHIVVFGIQYFIREYLMNQFNVNFFARPLSEVLAKYQQRIDHFCGTPVPNDHIAELHRLGYLPLVIKALPEGTLCPIGTPCLTIWNTDPRAYWVVNYLETLMSCVLWGPMTSATTAYKLRRALNAACAATGGDPGVVPFQAHDFSMRGMYGLEAAVLSGAAHLLSFEGTDCVPALDFLEQYYGHQTPPSAGVGVPATEHSVMCAGSEEGEFRTFQRLLTEIHPTGILSVVSDSWDYWRVIDDYLPALRAEILARDGKLVIRPDSGDPVDIVLRTMPRLWHVFGGTVNPDGYRELDPHIGLIYGDGINYERMMAILDGLKAQGYASTNVVFGVGSYTYQYRTRDEFGFAMKATYCEIGEKGHAIFKRPKTDDGRKHSARGLLRVESDLSLTEGVDWKDEGGALIPVFRNGSPCWFETLDGIRDRLWPEE